jgi:hypothetical protein
MLLRSAELEAKMVPWAGRESAEPRKYLVRWTVLLGREELEKMSARPDALQKAFNYVKGMMKGSKVEIYRIVAMEEVTRSARPASEGLPKSVHPTGIAIAEASSVEEVRMMLEHLVEGLSFGGLPVPVQNYLEFEISPLMDIGLHGSKE